MVVGKVCVISSESSIGVRAKMKACNGLWVSLQFAMSINTKYLHHKPVISLAIYPISVLDMKWGKKKRNCNLNG